jgi:hypothetical protein
MRTLGKVEQGLLKFCPYEPNPLDKISPVH